MANGPDAGANRKRPLGTGQLVPPLFAQIRAQQYFLEAVEQEVASVITDLRDNVYPKYCEDKKFSGPLITSWIDKYNLRDPEGAPLDWVRSCAEHTLHAWSRKDGLDWAKPHVGWPELTVEQDCWARCNGLPAFETWIVDQEEVYKLTANLRDLPEYTSYD